MAGIRYYTVLAEGDDLTGQDIPLKPCTNRTQCTAFGSNHIGTVFHNTIAEGTETVGVPNSDQLLCRHHHERVCSVQFIHRSAHSRFNGRCGDSLSGDHIGNSLRIGGGMKNRTGKLQFLPQRQRIAQIAVMCQCQLSFQVVDFNWLAVT